MKKKELECKIEILEKRINDYKIEIKSLGIRHKMASSIILQLRKRLHKFEENEIFLFFWVIGLGVLYLALIVINMIIKWG